MTCKKEDIQSYLAEMKIESLVHFTRVENLSGILDHGLIGRDKLAARKIPYIYNDSLRLDGLPDSICLSISFPNYKMFYRQRSISLTSDWAVIRLRPSILWEKNCFFYPHNAANSAMAQLPTDQKIGVDAFERMFEDRDGCPSRDNTKIDTCFTTDPQGEVLVQDAIETKYISDILIDGPAGISNRTQLEELINAKSSQFTFLHGQAFFDARQDYRYWS